MHHTNIGPQLGGVTITVIAMMMRSLCSLLIQGVANRETRSISQVCELASPELCRPTRRKGSVDPAPGSQAEGVQNS